ncbi:hypothetical protein ABPG72_022518 [Tetrahymena utriculariae]
MSQQNSSKKDFESKYNRVVFTEQEIHIMKTPHAIMSSQKGWKKDRERSQEIDYMMKPYFGNKETELSKQKFVDELQEIVTKWSTELAQQILGVSAEESKQYAAKLLTFGSSILGVSSKKGDIDMVCTCPNFIKRNPHFEEELCQILLNNEHVKQLSNIRTAKVPIITFQYKEQDIDISFAQLQLPQLPPTIEEYVSDDLLINMEERDILSLSGRRCNQAIVRSIPNLQNFQITCRFIKLWAQSKGIYENSIGFLGGISWAILVAKICQMFPNYEANQLLDEFFYYYSNWDFSNVHVLLNDYYNQRTPKQRAITLYMNVMTACYPEYNSTERVKEITLFIIKQRLHEANELIQKEIKYQYKHYKDLLVNYDFVNNYQVFIEYSLQYPEKVKTQVTDKEFEDFMNASKVKILNLIQRLSESRPQGVEFCPWPQFFAKTQVSYKKIQVLYIGINDNSEEKNQDLEKDCKQQIQSFYQLLKNEQKYSTYLEKFDVGMDWISNKEIIKKTYKLTQSTYEITIPKDEQDKQDISKYEVTVQKKIKLNEQGNQAISSNNNGIKDSPHKDNQQKQPQGDDEEEQAEENCDINDFY